METEQQIRNRENARFVFGNCDDGSLDPDDAIWDLVEFPVEDLLPLMEGGAEGWRQWLDAEISNWREDYGTPSRWEHFLSAPSLQEYLREHADGPCVAAADDEGGIVIWDGWHRIAAHVVRGEGTVGILIGRRMKPHPSAMSGLGAD
jgi:hypothetical protein